MSFSAPVAKKVRHALLDETRRLYPKRFYWEMVRFHLL